MLAGEMVHRVRAELPAVGGLGEREQRDRTAVVSAGSLAVLLRADLRPGCGHPSPALISAWHTSMMSATPRRPASPATGR